MKECHMKERNQKIEEHEMSATWKSETPKECNM